MTKEEIIACALALPDSAADCPFQDDLDTTVLRHADTGKWFGILLQAPCRRVGLKGSGSATVLNVKCTPDDGFILREMYAGILPAYHMNKLHWVTVLPEADVPPEVIGELLYNSHALTAKKHRR